MGWMFEVVMRIPYICECTRYANLSELSEEGARKEMEERESAMSPSDMPDRLFQSPWIWN
jgi:hypothetical protein